MTRHLATYTRIFLDLDWQHVYSAIQEAYQHNKLEFALTATSALTRFELGVFGYLDNRGQWQEAQLLLETCHQKCTPILKPLQKAAILITLGAIENRLAQHQASERHLQESLQLLNSLPASIEISWHQTLLYSVFSRLSAM